MRFQNKDSKFEDRLYELNVQHRKLGVTITGHYYTKKRENLHYSWWRRAFSSSALPKYKVLNEWNFEEKHTIWDMVGPSDISTLWNVHGDEFPCLAEEVRTNKAKLKLSQDHEKILKSCVLVEGGGPYREAPAAEENDPDEAPEKDEPQDAEGPDKDKKTNKWLHAMHKRARPAFYRV